MRYVLATYHRMDKELAYRIYISDMLRAIGEGKVLNYRYFDLIKSNGENDIGTQDSSSEESADEIIARITKKMDMVRKST